MFMRLMDMFRFEKTDSPGEGNPEEERERELHTIVSVKGDFRQQIGQRNAEKHSSGKGERTSNDDLLVAEHAS